ncbi:MAG TPA: PQQ-dependent sugar dehydrogenase [Chitinophagaceae bacterium]|nr:PQQ-dependent sugar dehydrogenase [Chitinophagaceae bacterium]
MNEVYKQTVLSPANGLNDPWEITYGSDGYLWITESKGYKVYRMDPATGTKTTVLDISQNATFLPTADQTFDVQFGTGQNPWPQGGLAGLALHPKFLDATTPKNYVYISYVYKFISNNDPNGCFFQNRIVRFTYNTSTGKLESPVSVCDTLPGSSDHNSQRLIIAPVSGTYYLFYGQGDMGAGQFANRLRTNNAQNVNSYEGKILRFNLEPDGDAGTYDQWIPNDNPYNGTAQSAVWAMGIRNNQGFAYDTATGILYGSSHGPYSDDEINIIEKGKNYGHPLVEGFASDGNYNGISAGTAPNMTGGSTSACPIITDEATNAANIGSSYKDPLFTAYAGSSGQVINIWNTTTGSNGSWPSEAWSGMDVYKNSYIPGWKSSLIMCSLKWGRLIRLKLGSTGTTIASTGGYDTISYFGSTNRYRDLAFDPNGKDIYVIMDKSSTTSGPSALNPIVPACGGCVVKYSFLGYADASGKSSIPDAIDITTTTSTNTCVPATTVTIDNSNNMLWVPITGPDGNILAEIYPNGNNLGTVTSSFYIHTGSIRKDGTGRKYMDRSMTITPAVQPSTPVKIRLYFTNAEFAALQASPNSGVTSLSDLLIRKNSDPCSGTLTNATTNIGPTYAEVHGTSGYMLQYDNLPGFSSFYFGSSLITLPLKLVYFKGSYEKQGSVLQWETANENNTSHFEVERSLDGRSFRQIGTVAAAGNSTVNLKYNYTDYEAATQGASILYYRLRMVDLDGAYTYSNIVTVTIPDFAGRVTLFPNPASENVTVTVSAPQDGRITWEVVDNTGRVVLQSAAQMKKGSNTFPVNVRKLASGMYFLKLAGAGVDQQVKLQKL